MTKQQELLKRFRDLVVWAGGRVIYKRYNGKLSITIEADEHLRQRLAEGGAHSKGLSSQSGIIRRGTTRRLPKSHTYWGSTTVNYFDDELDSKLRAIAKSFIKAQLSRWFGSGYDVWGRVRCRHFVIDLFVKKNFSVTVELYKPGDNEPRNRFVVEDFKLPEVAYLIEKLDALEGL